MKGLEQVQCKFYHELARFLLKEHRSPPSEAIAETDDNDSPSRSVPDVGTKKSPRVSDTRFGNKRVSRSRVKSCVLD